VVPVIGLEPFLHYKAPTKEGFCNRLTYIVSARQKAPPMKIEGEFVMVGNSEKYQDYWFRTIALGFGKEDVFTVLNVDVNF